MDISSRSYLTIYCLQVPTSLPFFSHSIATVTVIGGGPSSTSTDSVSISRNSTIPWPVSRLTQNQKQNALAWPWISIEIERKPCLDFAWTWKIRSRWPLFHCQLRPRNLELITWSMDNSDLDLERRDGDRVGPARYVRTVAYMHTMHTIDATQGGEKGCDGVGMRVV